VPLTTERLADIDLFSDLDRRDLRSLANSFKEVTFSPGEEIVGEDKGGVGFFIIESGEASVTVHGEERATLKAGDHFGEIALIDEGARTATVTAETEVHCYGLTSWAFRPLVEHNPTIAWKLLRIMARRLREAQSRN
jgi:CRP/FNR family transcriptional regulator, cyclic AMP receptor protein